MESTVMRICYECGKEIQDQKEMVLKEFKIANWGVKWIKPFHVECWHRRTRNSRQKYRKIILAVMLPICTAIFYWIFTLF